MKLIRPTDVTDAILSSSSVAETEHPAWDAPTIYAKGDKVIREHQRFESLQDANSGHDPLLDDRKVPVWWVYLGPTNTWAMFDQSVGSSTVGTGEIVIVLTPGAIDALVILDTDAELVTVEMTVDGTVVYSQTQSTNAGGQAITDAWTYFFEPIGIRSSLRFLDIPAYGDGVLTVTLLGADAGGPVGCGTLGIGRQLDMGTTEAGVKLGGNDFSKVREDDYGNITIDERPFARTLQGQSLIDTSEADAMYQAVVAQRAKASIWIVEGQYDTLTVFGFMRTFEFSFASENVSYFSWTLRSLT